jgi:hypothetical protein
MCLCRLNGDHRYVAEMVDAGVKVAALVMVLARACSAAMPEEGPSRP